jgi:hypothetical protein
LICPSNEEEEIPMMTGDGHHLANFLQHAVYRTFPHPIVQQRLLEDWPSPASWTATHCVPVEEKRKQKEIKEYDCV